MPGAVSSRPHSGDADARFQRERDGTRRAAEDQLDAIADAKRVDILVHSSGGDALAAWKLMSMRFLASEVKVTEQVHVSAIIEKLFSVVDPVHVGAAKRASELSSAVGERLLLMHMVTSEDRARAPVVNAILESSRLASEVRTTGKLSAARNIQGAIQLAGTDTESSWKQVKPIAVGERPVTLAHYRSASGFDAPAGFGL